MLASLSKKFLTIIITWPLNIGEWFAQMYNHTLLSINYHGMSEDSEKLIYVFTKGINTGKVSAKI